MALPEMCHYVIFDNDYEISINFTRMSLGILEIAELVFCG